MCQTFKSCQIQYYVAQMFRYHAFDSEMSKSEGINDTALMYLRKGQTVQDDAYHLL